jgi:mannosyltransferase
VTGLFVLPAVVTLLVAVLLGHNLRPRFVFFSVGFAILIAVRGTFVLAEALFRRRAQAIGTAALTTATLAAVLKIPAAWGPKQDFVGAASFVDGASRPQDAVVTVDLTGYPYRAYFQRHWTEVTGVGQLKEIEQQHDRTWLLYTFPISAAAVQPDLWTHLHQVYDTAAVFKGTVGDGDIVVMVTSHPRSAVPATPSDR